MKLNLPYQQSMHVVILFVIHHDFLSFEDSHCVLLLIGSTATVPLGNTDRQTDRQRVRGETSLPIHYLHSC